MFPARVPIISQPPVATTTALSNNYSLSFDGSNDYVACGTSTTLEPVNVSVSVWINMQEESGFNYLISKNYSGGQSAYALLTHTSGADNFRFYVTTAGGLFTSPTFRMAGESGTWNHLVATYDGDFVRLYKNGSEIDSGTDTSDAGDIVYLSSQTFEIGAFRTILNANAIMDEVGVFDTAISAADVTALYNLGTPNDLTESGSYDTDRTGNLIGYWRFEEGTGTEVADSSTNSNTGTLINAPTWSTDVPAS